MGLYFSICTLIILIAFVIDFFIKKKVQNIETKIYSVLIVVTIIGLFLEALTGIFYNIDLDTNLFIFRFFSKTVLIYYIVWSLVYAHYIICVCHFNRKVIRILNIIAFISILLTYILPISYAQTEDAILPQGLCLIMPYMACILFSIVDQFYCIKYRKTVVKKKISTVYIFLAMGSANIVLQMIMPGLFLLGFILAYMVIIMYFTIENPDVKVIEQLTRNKKLIEKSNEEKSNFLFKMSQEVRKPIDDIIRINNIVANTDDKETIIKGTKFIDLSAKNLKTLVYDVLDVSKLDSYNIKMIENSYSVYNVFKEFISKYQSIIGDEIEFRYNISKNIPKYLYGDVVKLKQIINTIMQNAVDYTEKGFIDLQVDAIVKNDVCRLIIAIEDSGCGMSLDKINNLLSVDNELSERELKKLENMNLNLNIATKIIRLLGGQIIIRSEENVGSEFIVTIEQRIVKNRENNDLEQNVIKYSRTLFSRKSILIVTDKKNLMLSLSEFFKKYEVDIYNSMYGQDCIDRVNVGNKYDLIIMDDEMQPKTGYNTLQELQKILRFKTPVIIVLDKSKSIIKEHYLKDGFSDYVFVENLTDDLNKVIKKYI